MNTKYPLILIVLSPVVAELLSGSSPFFTFFNLRVLLVFLAFYGFGALLIREVAAHKKLNYASVLLLGAAFGVLEEGIILKSWFDPTWMGAQITSQALVVYGVVVLQPFANIVYHAVVSIAAPIVLVESVTSRAPWLSHKMLWVCGIVFSVGAVLLATFNDCAIRPWQYLLGIVLFGFFIFLGLKGIVFSPTNQGNPLQLWVLSSLFVVLLFVIFYTLTSAGFPWSVILVLALCLYGLYARMYSRTQCGSKHYFAAAAGVVMGLLPIVMIMARTDPSKVLNVVAALLFGVGLIVVYKKEFAQ